MNLKRFALTFLALSVTLSTVQAQSLPASDLAAMVVGIGADGRVIAAGVPFSSGGWGTDYITVSHALGVRRRYFIADGTGVAQSEAVAACSSQYHGIDVLILRVKSHPLRPRVEWGDPAHLNPGDRLMILVRREFHPAPVRVKFVHANLLEWANSKPAEWPPAWHNVMVGAGLNKPGFSGSPWVKDGKVYGLHKGGVRPGGHATWAPVAETATRVRQCLAELHYNDLVPRE